MITKAIIEKVISDYEVKVRIPLLDSTTAFKQSVDIDGLSSATICISPKSRFIPAVGDIVFVAFEDNDAGKPVIIGCLQKETGNISSLDLNVESLNASSSINLSNNTTIGNLSYEKINSLFDIKDQEIDELKKIDKATTDALAKKMDNFSISIGSTNGGNPRQVKFMSINYTTATSEAGVSIKLSMVSGHGNGSSYRFLQDAILGVTYTGVVSVDVYKYYNASVGTFDGSTRNYGDIFYVKDETNKIVDFYVLLGQYSTVKVTPYFRLNASTGGVITQLSGTPTYYSSGTKVYGNNSLYAKNSDIPIVSQSTGTSTTEVMSQKATTDELAKKLQFIEDTTGSADPSPLEDYYNKAQSDTLLNQKANASLNNISPNLTSSSVTLINKSGTRYSGAHIVVESWKADDSSAWYRKYNDGFKECGGKITGSGSFGYYTTNFPTTFLTSNYSIVVTGFWGDDTGRGSVVIKKSESSFQVNLTNESGNATYFACGY